MKKRSMMTAALIAASALLSGCNGPAPSQNSTETTVPVTSIPDTSIISEAETDAIVTETAVSPETNSNDYDNGYQKGYEDGFAEGRMQTEPKETSSELTVNVTGSFTATVRKLIPDYVAEPGNTAAVVTLFQSEPFVLKLNAEMCERLEEDQTYTFIVKEEETAIPTDMLWENDNSVSWDALILRKISVSDVRAAEDDEYGMNCWRVKYSKD